MTREPQGGQGHSTSRPPEGEGSGSDSDTRWEVADRHESAESEQTISDSDQTASDTDQTASDADQARAESDQRAANRDQAAADREIARHPENREHLAEYRRTRAERGFSMRERQTGTLVRLRTAVARDEQAARRDAIAAKRDMAASARDELAASLDVEAERAENGVHIGDGNGLRDALTVAASARRNAATDRARAARDRERAAADRENAARDRNEATQEIQAAHLDDLTGAYRRGMGEAILNHELLRSARSGSPLIVAFVDVDQLKAVNDSEGYTAGDTLLRNVAAALTDRLRPYDAVIRTGGDEFVCVLSDVNLKEARERMTEVNESLPAASFTFGLTAALPDDTSATVIERSSVQMRESRELPKRFPSP